MMLEKLKSIYTLPFIVIIKSYISSYRAHECHVHPLIASSIVMLLLMRGTARLVRGLYPRYIPSQ